MVFTGSLIKNIPCSWRLHIVMGHQVVYGEGLRVHNVANVIQNTEDKIKIDDVLIGTLPKVI